MECIFISKNLGHRLLLSNASKENVSCPRGNNRYSIHVLYFCYFFGARQNSPTKNQQQEMCHLRSFNDVIQQDNTNAVHCLLKIRRSIML